jgi:hypothetical protein
MTVPPTVPGQIVKVKSVASKLSAFRARSIWGGCHSGWGWLAAALLVASWMVFRMTPSGDWKIPLMYGSLLFAVLSIVDQVATTRSARTHDGRP